MDHIIATNKPKVTSSTVESTNGAGATTDSTRNSSTAWDSSPPSIAIEQRVFSILGVEWNRQQADGIQVLRYEKTEWYKPHVDYFHFPDMNPLKNNGTNRMATVFMYMSDVELGGETVFPLSKSHEGYNGEVITTSRSAGAIEDKEAIWACNTSSTAMRAKPKKGTAVIFYSQKNSGELRPDSMHGACAVREGVKWSANVWVWNRNIGMSKPKPPVGHKQRPAKKDNNEIEVFLKNDNPDVSEATVYWINHQSGEEVLSATVAYDREIRMNSYLGHQFRSKSASGEILKDFKVQKDTHTYEVA